MKQISIKPWIFLTGICVCVLLSGVPFLLFSGYCRGVWGRHSLLFQYLFQCDCPAASTAARFPSNVDVIFPGCIRRGVIVSPGGKFLYVREQEKDQVTTYMFDVQAREKIPFVLPGTDIFSFLTDDSLYISVAYGENYILNWATGEKHPIPRYTSLYPNEKGKDDVNQLLLVQALQKAKDIYYIDQSRTVIALGADFPASSDNSFIFDQFDLEGYNPDRVKQLLRSNDFVFHTILPYFPEAVLSPDGRFLARPEGVYLLKTGQKILEGYSPGNPIWGPSPEHFFARGWTDHGRSVIYSEFLNPCLIETGFFISDETNCYYEVPQPVIKMNVPEEYLVGEPE